MKFRTPQIIFGVGLVVLIAFGTVIGLFGGPPSAAPPEERQQSEREPEYVDVKPRLRSSKTIRGPSHEASPFKETARGTTTTGDRAARTADTSSTPTPAPTNSNGSEPHTTSDQSEGWEDPTNDVVLGPRAWMAETDDEERARIDQVFDASRAARFDPRLSNRDRAGSIQVMKSVVDACFQELRRRIPSASGRIIVAWTAGARGGEGVIENPRIKVNYKLEDDAFEGCILGGAQNLRFPATDGDPIDVEVPFFYDGAF